MEKDVATQLQCRFADGSVATLEDFIQEAAAASNWKDAEGNADAAIVDRVHARLLPYDEFVAKYMQPNRPVLIQASKPRRSC